VDVEECYSSSFEILGDPPEESKDAMYSRACRIDDAGRDVLIDLARQHGDPDLCNSCTGTGETVTNLLLHRGFRAEVYGTVSALASEDVPVQIQLMSASMSNGKAAVCGAIGTIQRLTSNSGSSSSGSGDGSSNSGSGSSGGSSNSGNGSSSGSGGGSSGSGDGSSNSGSGNSSGSGGGTSNSGSGSSSDGNESEGNEADNSTSGGNGSNESNPDQKQLQNSTSSANELSNRTSFANEAAGSGSDKTGVTVVSALSVAIVVSLVLMSLYGGLARSHK
jgi:hypothetical protein